MDNCYCGGCLDFRIESISMIWRFQKFWKRFFYCSGNWVVVEWEYKRKSKNMIYVLTGDGQGKTSCALGMAARAAGGGKKVLTIQFLKRKEDFSQGIISSIPNLDFAFFSRKCFVMPKEALDKNPSLAKMGIQPINNEDYKLCQSGFCLAVDSAKNGKYNFIVLDELPVVIKYGLLKLNDILDFLKQYGQKVDFVITGRDCPKEIIDLADIVTEFKEIKHNFNQGAKQKRGQEY
jgi:cob(I)alamin adenosyltransferase